MTSTPPERRERHPARWHRLEIASTLPDGDTSTRRAEGDDAWVAASLRALADQLDPPRPTMRPPRPAVNMQGGMPRAGMVALPPPSDVPRRDPMSM